MQSKAQFGKLTPWFYCTVLCCSMLFVQCKSKPAPEIKKIDMVALFEKIAGDSVSVQEFRELQQTHPEFFNQWYLEIMGMNDYLSIFKVNGKVSDTIKAQILTIVMKKNTKVINLLNSHYKKYPSLNQSIDNAFDKVKKLLPDAKMPTVYRYLSQFSNSNTISIGDSNNLIIGYSAEMFLNDTFSGYKPLEVPEFFNRYNATNYIPKMLVWTYLTAYFKQYHTHNNMLEESIYRGKIWYLMNKIFEEDQPWQNLGYSEKEWTFFEKEEGNEWQYVIKENVLYESDEKKYQRFFVEGTHTFGAGIAEDCPPMLGSFLGYRIVQTYLDKTGADLNSMLKETKGTVFLQKSGFNPLR